MHNTGEFFVGKPDKEPYHLKKVFQSLIYFHMHTVWPEVKFNIHQLILLYCFIFLYLDTGADTGL